MEVAQRGQTTSEKVNSVDRYGFVLPAGKRAGMFQTHKGRIPCKNKNLVKHKKREKERFLGQQVVEEPAKASPIHSGLNTGA